MYFGIQLNYIVSINAMAEFNYISQQVDLISIHHTMFGFAILILLLIGSFYFQIYKSKRSHGRSKRPPGTNGWPIVGESFAFFAGPEKFISDRMRKLSPDVFQTSLAGENVAVFCGASANKFLFSNEGKLVRFNWPRSMRALVSHHNIDHNSSSWKLVNELSYKFLRLESIKQYMPVIDSVVRKHLDTQWSPFNEVKAFPLAADFTFALACQLFVKPSDIIAEQLKELTQPLDLIKEAFYATPLNVPSTCYHKAMKEGPIIMKKLVEIVRQRKMEILSGMDHESSHSDQDMLSQLLMAFDGDGKFPKEEDIAITLFGLFFASIHATRNAITSVISHLADHPDVYEKVLQEQLEIAQSKGSGQHLTWADIQSMKYSWNTVCESMRVTAPTAGGFREAISDFTYADYNIPKGSKVYWTLHSTHKNDEYFRDPDKFDPTRFETEVPIPYTFVPFGGGPRMCPGKEYARIEILAFLHHVVTRFRLKKVNSNEKIYYNPDPTPTEGLPIWLQPHHE